MIIPVPWNEFLNAVAEIAHGRNVDDITLDLAVYCRGGGWSGCAGPEEIDVDINVTEGEKSVCIGNIAMDKSGIVEVNTWTR